MNTSAILNSLSRYITLDGTETLYFTSLLLPIKLRQNEFAENAGEVTKGIFYVNSGCVMTYFTDREDNDHVIQFATTGWWTGDLNSITKQVPAIYSTKALADSELFLLPKKDMDDLLERVPKFEKYFRIISQNSIITHQERIIRSFSNSADDRYAQFQEKYPSLEQYVPLKYVASYLGITPEFLSKIRRRRSEK